VELTFAQDAGLRAHRERTVLYRVFTATIAVHATLLFALAWNHWQPVRLGTSAADVAGSIGAFVMAAPKPVATTGAAPRKPTTPRPVAARPSPAISTQQGVGDAESTPVDVGGPVRLMLGGNLRLLKKVIPFYPPMQAAAGIEGTVILDATIHRDGSVGEITVVRASNQAFVQPAIDAVRQWRYTELPYEGLLTVTLNFTRQPG
jgi:TonB family protein